MLAELPTLDELTRLQTDALAGADGVVGSLDGMDPGAEGSPLAGVATSMASLQEAADLDVTGLTESLPAALERAQALLPASAADLLPSLEGACADVSGRLADLPGDERAPGADHPTVQSAARAVVDDAAAALVPEATALAGGLVDSATLAAVARAADRLEALRSDFDTHRDHLAPVFAEQLLGVEPDVLDGPLGRVRGVLAVLDPLGSATSLADATHSAMAGLDAAVAALDPAKAAGYRRLVTALADVRAASETATAGLERAYRDLATRLERTDWAGLGPALAAALDAVDPPALPGLATAADDAAALLEALIGRVGTLADASLVPAAGLLEAAVGEVRRAIDALPVEAAVQTARDLLTQLGEVITSLDLGRIARGLDEALGSVEATVAEGFAPELIETARAGIEQVAARLDDLPLDQLVETVRGVVDQADAVLASVGDAAAEASAELSEFTAQFEQLSFAPVADEVIAELDELKARLASIDPAALSEVENRAIAIAVSALESLDVKGEVIAGLKALFAAAQDQVRGVLEQLKGQVEALRRYFDMLDPERLLGPVQERLDRASRLVEGVSVAPLLEPLAAEVDALAERLAGLAPGRLMPAAVQEAFDSVRTTLAGLDPDAWLAPLVALRGELDRALGLVDSAPLIDDLERRADALIVTSRAALLDGLTAVSLPQPVAGVLAALRPVLDAVLGAEQAADVDLRPALAALDAPFDAVGNLMRTLPADAVEDAIARLRALAAALDAIDPAALEAELRAGLERLGDMRPSAVLEAPLGLPAIRDALEAAFAQAPAGRAEEVAAVRADLDGALAVVEAGALDRLDRLHSALVTQLGAVVDGLRLDTAATAFVRVRDTLGARIPDVLRGGEQPSRDAVLAAIDALRPSRAAGELEDVLRRLTAAAATQWGGLAASAGRVFDALRRTDEIVAAVRRKLAAADPALLAADLREHVLAPVLAQLDALDPGPLVARVDQAFARVVETVRSTARTFLDDLGAAADAALAKLRKAVLALVGELKRSIAAVGQFVRATLDRVEQLVFVDLLPRLDRGVEAAGRSFGREVDRVGDAFDEMLAAIPLERA